METFKYLEIIELAKYYIINDGDTKDSIHIDNSLPIMMLLNKYGQEGWELVTKTNKVCTLKKKIQK